MCSIHTDLHSIKSRCLEAPFYTLPFPVFIISLYFNLINLVYLYIYRLFIKLIYIYIYIYIYTYIYNTSQTVGCGIPSSLLVLRVHLRGLPSKLSWIRLLRYTWSAGAFTFTQTAYLLKLVIPTTNVLPRWRLNVETKTKRKPHSNRRLSFNELTNAKKYCAA